MKKASYQLDLERLRTAQKQLEREKAQLKRDMERLPQMWLETDHNQVNAANRQAPGGAALCRELPAGCRAACPAAAIAWLQPRPGYVGPDV